MTAGDSTGGLPSIYLALSQPDKIRAATATYPALHWDSPPIYSSTPSAMIGNPPPESFIDEYVAEIKPGQTESSDLALQRVQLSSALTAHRRGGGFYIRDADASAQRDRLFQLSRLEKPGTKLPRGGLVILHGVDDDVVPMAASQRFVDKGARGTRGIDRLVFCKRPGNHGFDASARAKERWLADALQVAIETWLE